MARSRRNEIGVGCLVLAAALLLAYMSLKVGAIQGLGKTVTVTARLPDAAGLTEGAMVKVAGVDVGLVDRLQVEHDVAVVTLSLEEAAQLRDDVVVQVRARSVLGEKYVELRPQSKDAPLLQDGDVLDTWEGQTEIDQLVNAMGPLVGALDPDALNKTFKALSEALEEDPERAKRMLEDLETILHNGAKASEELPETVTEARAAISETRTTLRKVRGAVDEARPAIAKADGILTDVEAATADLPATVDEVELLITDTRGAVEDGRELIGKLDASTGDIELILDNLSEIDKWELRRLLREEGIKVRLKAKKVVPDDE